MKAALVRWKNSGISGITKIIFAADRLSIRGDALPIFILIPVLDKFLPSLIMKCESEHLFKRKAPWGVIKKHVSLGSVSYRLYSYVPDEELSKMTPDFEINIHNSLLQGIDNIPLRDLNPLLARIFKDYRIEQPKEMEITPITEIEWKAEGEVSGLVELLESY